MEDISDLYFNHSEDIIAYLKVSIKSECSFKCQYWLTAVIAGSVEIQLVETNPAWGLWSLDSGIGRGGLEGLDYFLGGGSAPPIFWPKCISCPCELLINFS